MIGVKPREVVSKHVNESDGSGVKSAERALTILELFSMRDTALTFSEVAQRLGYPRSSLHGLLRTLARRGWLHYDAATRRFALGLRAWEAGNAYLPAVELRRHAVPVLDRLHDVFAADVRVAVLDAGESVPVAAAGTAEHSAGRTPATASAAGELMLADLDRDERERQVEQALAAKSLSMLSGSPQLPRLDPDALHARLDEARSRGWASDDGDDATPGGWLAVPVRDRDGVVVAALEMAVSVQRLTTERRDEVLRALRDAAQQIAAALGYAIAV